MCDQIPYWTRWKSSCIATDGRLVEPSSMWM